MEKSKINEAVERKRSGRYNCAQAIACTYCAEAGIDEETARCMAASFGTGMGSLEGTCGAIVGAGMVIGMVRKDRVSAMRDMRTLTQKFLKANGSVTCRDLKGVGTGKPLRACNDCVADAAALLEEALGDI